ncbi:MAG: hypothetical protein AB1714_16130 [Acidobacteriota bacterium]
MGRGHWCCRESGRRVCLVAAMSLLAAAFVCPADEPDLESGWLDRAVTIDGASDEWEGVLKAIEKPGLIVGMLNDEEYLYITVIPQGRDLRAQMLGQGFILWLDPAGGKNKVFGIKFPLGFSGRPDMGMPPGDPGRLDPAAVDAGSMLEILGPGKDDRHRLPVENSGGIEVKVTAQEWRLVYEIKIPLAMSEEHQSAIRTQAGRLIGVGMATPELDREKMKEQMGGRGPEGGGTGGPGGGFGGPGGGMGGPPPGGGMGGPRGGPMGSGGPPSPPKPLNFWMKVRLASRSTALPE